MLSDPPTQRSRSRCRMRLNPCSNGICSLTEGQDNGGQTYHRLNPCSNGICSLTPILLRDSPPRHCLNPCSNGICSLTYPAKFKEEIQDLVLILVLMEYAL